LKCYADRLVEVADAVDNNGSRAIIFNAIEVSSGKGNAANIAPRLIREARQAPLGLPIHLGKVPRNPNATTWVTDNAPNTGGLAGDAAGNQASRSEAPVETTIRKKPGKATPDSAANPSKAAAYEEAAILFGEKGVNGAIRS